MTTKECPECLRQRGQHADWCSKKDDKAADINRRLTTCDYCGKTKGHAPHCPLMFGMYGPKLLRRKGAIR